MTGFRQFRRFCEKMRVDARLREMGRIGERRERVFDVPDGLEFLDCMNGAVEGDNIRVALHAHGDPADCDCFLQRNFRMDGGAVGVDDVGQTAGQCQVLVEQLEAVGQGQEGTDGDGGHDVGDGDLPAVGAVDLGGFHHVFGNCLEAGDVNDHHITDLLPAGEDY